MDSIAGAVPVRLHAVFVAKHGAGPLGLILDHLIDRLDRVLDLRELHGSLGDEGRRVDDDLGHLAPVRDQPLAGFLQLLNVTVRHGTNPLQTQVTPRQNTMFACIGSTEAAGVLKVVGIGGESSPPNPCIDQTAKVDA
jgi:hypothetical protein